MILQRFFFSVYSYLIKQNSKNCKSMILQRSFLVFILTLIKKYLKNCKSMILQRYCLVFILPYLANSINFIKDNYVQTRVSSYTYTQLPIKKKEKNTSN